MSHFEIEKKKKREKQQFIITHRHIQTVKKIKQFIHPSKPIRIDCWGEEWGVLISLTVSRVSEWKKWKELLSFF